MMTESGEELKLVGGRIGIGGNIQNKVTMLFCDLGKFSGFRLGREQTAHTGACSCANHVTWTWWYGMGQ